jgi:hypothetical protein
MEDFFDYIAERFDSDPDIMSRRGRFHLSQLMMNNAPGDVARVLGLMAVFRCEMMMAYDSFEYCAISPLFEPLKHGYKIPEYSIELSEGLIRARKL